MIIYGASGHAKVVADILECAGVKIDYVVDDNQQIGTLLGYDVKRDCGHYDEAIVCIGNAAIRKAIVERLDVKHWRCAIHPKAVVSQYANIGEGTVVMAGAVINAGAQIGKHCIINTGATIDHDVVLRDYVHVAPGAHLSGSVLVGEGTWIGVGSCVKQGTRIGEWTLIGAGSVVVKDIPDNVKAFGCPCRAKNINDNKMKKNELLQLGGVNCQLLSSK